MPHQSGNEYSNRTRTGKTGTVTIKLSHTTMMIIAIDNHELSSQLYHLIVELPIAGLPINLLLRFYIIQQRVQPLCNKALYLLQYYLTPSSFPAPSYRNKWWRPSLSSWLKETSTIMNRRLHLLTKFKSQQNGRKTGTAPHLYLSSYGSG